MAETAKANESNALWSHFCFVRAQVDGQPCGVCVHACVRERKAMLDKVAFRIVITSNLNCLSKGKCQKQGGRINARVMQLNDG